MATTGHPTGVPNPKAGRPRTSAAPPVRRPPRCYTSAPSRSIAGDPMTESVAGTAPEQTVAWHSLTPAEALERQGVTVAQGLTTTEVDARRAKYGPNKFAEGAKEPRWQAFVRQYKDPMQIVLLAAGILSLFIPNQVADRRRPHRADPAERGDGPQPGGQGVGERGRPPEDDGRQGEGPSRRGARRSPDGRPGAWRHREHRGRRPRPRGRADPDRRHPRDRRVGADRGERPGPEAGRGRSRPTRPSATGSTLRS